MTAGQLILELAKELTASGFQDAEFEARQLVAKATGKQSNQLFKFLDITTAEENLAKDLLKRRLFHEPLQYILGEWEFYGLPFKVRPGVLIPRADTETAVEIALELLRDVKSPVVLDLCAGSGCIGITLAKLTGGRVVCVEKSDEAISVLEENKALNKVGVEVLKADVLKEPPASLIGAAHLLISNPPYIKTGVIETLDAEVKREPKMALDGGEDGLLFYKSIVEKWSKVLKPGGVLVFEIGFDQCEAVVSLLENDGFKNVGCKKDLGQNDRVVYGVKFS